MNDSELLKFSESQKEIANKIIADSALVPLLSKYGRCSIIGSLSLDLMYGPDIDMVVETDDPRIASVSAIKELIENRQFQKYQYGDFVKFPRKDRPSGFIVVLISEVEGVKWETEVWFMEKYPQDKIERDLRFKESLTPESRLPILRLKQTREKHGDDNNKVSSTNIYQAVLVNGVTDYLKILNKNINKII